MTIYSLDVLLSQFWASPLFYVQFCFFLTCIQISQEVGKIVWYSHLFKNFPQFVVIHTVKDFSVVNEAEVDVLLEFSCFFCDPANVGNLISGSSAFSKSSLYIWKFPVHILLKSSLEAFEHYFASVWDECNCEVVWTFFGIAFLWGWDENWPFPVLCSLLSFPHLLQIECSAFPASSPRLFWIWNGSAGVPSPPLALFVVILPKAHHTPECLALGEWWHHCGYLGHQTPSCTVLLCILATSS